MNVATNQIYTCERSRLILNQSEGLKINSEAKHLLLLFFVDAPNSNQFLKTYTAVCNNNKSPILFFVYRIDNPPGNKELISKINSSRLDINIKKVPYILYFNNSVCTEFLAECNNETFPAFYRDIVSRLSRTKPNFMGSTPNGMFSSGNLSAGAIMREGHDNFMNQHGMSNTPSGVKPPGWGYSYASEATKYGLGSSKDQYGKFCKRDDNSCLALAEWDNLISKNKAYLTDEPEMERITPETGKVGSNNKIR